MDAKKLFETGEQLFTKRSSLINLWQEIADNFYPERADFTTGSSGGSFADNLTTSYPILACRDLGNAFSSMLRPSDRSWFSMVLHDDKKLDSDGKKWLEWAGGLMRRVMYDRNSLFVRATKEGDRDFAAFGQCAISVELNRNADGLLFRSWHLRDMAWAENEEGKIGSIFRKWKPQVRDLVRLFGEERLHRDTVRDARKEPFKEGDCRHIVVEADLVDGKFDTPYVSIYYDAEHNHVIEMIGVRSPIYVIPRWQTVSGSQYAYSPATIAALPDARLIQAMTYTLLEAGEKYVNPPMIAIQEAIRSDVALYAGGITWADAQYDERLGEVLRPLTQDKSGIPLGAELTRETRLMIAEAFFLNKLTLPQRAPEMTAYEVGQRIQQYIRDALPLFEPMEMDYNGALCEEIFSTLLRSGAFGSPFDLPRSLQGADVLFRFESPLHRAIEVEKANRLVEAQTYISTVGALDPSATVVLDARVALREALESIGLPEKWMRDEKTVDGIVARQQQAIDTQTTLANLRAGAEAATAMGEAKQKLSTGGGII